MPEGCNNPYISIYLQSASDQLKPHSFRIFGGSRGGIQQHYPGVGAETWLNLHVRTQEVWRLPPLWRIVEMSCEAKDRVVCGGRWGRFLSILVAFHQQIPWRMNRCCAGLVVAVGPSFSRMQAQWARVGRSRVDGFSWRTTGDADAFMVPQISFIWKTYSW